MDRRQFFERIRSRFAYWVPLLGLFGFRFCAYSAGTARQIAYSGWIEWFGRTVGFVEKSGRILWMWCPK